MEKLLKRAVLYDYYGELLNEKQKRIVGYSVLEDMSLSEIGEAEGISRQAASDLLRRADERLEEFEKALRIVNKSELIKECIRNIRKEEITESSKKELRRIEEVLES